jgi:molecular chaperone IbpA
VADGQMSTSMLLTGGYGHGSFRFLSVVPFDDRLRSSDPLGRCGDPRLPPLQHRENRRRRGFSPAELDITVQESTLLVAGKAQKEDENGGGYLHRGIARRSFERRFSLADHMKVMGASLDNGLLYVDVVREVPEAAKPRTIKIGTTVDTVQPQVTQQKAA